MTPFPDRVFDVAIVGGGMLGLSIARDCAMRRLSVVLFEREDFGFGSTGAASGILSGEPHWLDQDRVATRIACEEVGVIQRIAPNLLFRIPTLVPVLRGSARWQMERLEAFFDTYRPFSALKGGRPSQRIGAEEAREIEPGLSGEIIGAVSFDEWATEPNRLAILTARSAAAAGALLYNRCRVDGTAVQERRVIGIHVTPEDQTQTLVRARTVVNATGGWAALFDPERTASLPVRFHKSVYLALERPITSVGLACAQPGPGSTLFIIPHERISLLGPWETEVLVPPDKAVPTEADAVAIVEGIRPYFPRITEYRFLESRSGVRFRGQDPTTVEQGLRKSYLLADHAAQGAQGLFTMVGGTPPLARRMAEEMTDLLCEVLRKRERCRTHLESLPGCTPELPWPEEARRTGRDPLTVKRLMIRHGYHAAEILETATADRSLGQTLCECEGILAAEVAHCVRREWASGLGDVARRTGLGLGTCRGCRCIGATSRVLAGMLGWNEDRRRAEVDRFERARSPAVPLVGELAKQEEYAAGLRAFGGEIR